jgi:hypothetical protein
MLVLLVSSGFSVKGHACEHDLAGLSADYRAVRGTPGHFSGQAWNPAVDAWNGRKHVAMQRLADCAVQSRMSTALLRRWMGEPDAVLDCTRTDCAALLQRADAAAMTVPAQLWLYDWRGTHDRLVLGLTPGGVNGRAWLSDLE